MLGRASVWLGVLLGDGEPRKQDRPLPHLQLRQALHHQVERAVSPGLQSASPGFTLTRTRPGTEPRTEGSVSGTCSSPASAEDRERGVRCHHILDGNKIYITTLHFFRYIHCRSDVRFIFSIFVLYCFISFHWKHIR